MDKSSHLVTNGKRTRSRGNQGKEKFEAVKQLLLKYEGGYKTRVTPWSNPWVARTHSQFCTGRVGSIHVTLLLLLLCKVSIVDTGAIMIL